MLVVFFRAIILFSVVFIVIRLMGKRELSKVQPFELAIIVMISDLASGPMSSRDMSTFSGIIPILAMLVIYIIVTTLLQSRKKVEKILCGTPSLIIFKGKVIEEEFKKQQLTIEEIMEQLREVGIFKIQDTAYAILETSGKLNAIKTSEEVGQMPLNVISEGEYLEDNMRILKMKKEDVDKLLKAKNVKLKEVLVGTIDETGKFVYQKSEGDKK
ncbi:MAG: DUF421 domain-containing protein [Clostridia bacterium]|nr:DUF421 domain-containing protein [Clostridia bacterium]